jgi:Fic family protein
MLIAFTGSIGAGTSTLSQRVADLLGWPRVKFSDHIREVAAERGNDPNDLNVLQTIGQSLVLDELENFVEAVLSKAEWRKDGNLIVDGLRHIEVRTEMLRQIGTVPLHVVHLALPLPERAQNSGLAEIRLGQHDSELSEAQLDRILPQYANLILDGEKDHQELASRIIELFTGTGGGQVAVDAGEPIARMEPMLIGEQSPRKGEVVDLAVRLLERSKSLGAEVPKGLRRALGDVVRAMNSYYSNKIEGHITLPIDIERALKHDYSVDDKEKHTRQREAQAHIAVQRWLEGGDIDFSEITEETTLRRVHNQFFSQLPEELHWRTDDDTQEKWRITPGEYRPRYIRVGRHRAISPGAVPRFMKAFSAKYRKLGPTDRILAVPAAHHRFLWIHPFLDGNGRVARLMSDIMLRSAVDGDGWWSVSRGLARKQGTYQDLLDACDQDRRGDRDGRGNLSEECLANFTAFFLEVALDQVEYMHALVQPKRLEARIERLVDEEIKVADLTSLTGKMALHLLLYGDEDAGRLNAIAGDEAAGAAAIEHLISIGLIETREDKLGIALPTALLPRLLPGLFAEDA